MKYESKGKSVLAVTLLLCITASLCIPIFFHEGVWQVGAKEYLYAEGFSDTGASNLVSAIYLGYRAFDTLGETIVLMVSILGTMGIISDVAMQASAKNGASYAISLEKRHSHSKRTHLVESVTGKIGPIVLIFGFYVMLYGHLSPGGGFQGGVIVASGIVFLALGDQSNFTSSVANTRLLGKIEALAFFFLIMSSALSLFLHKGFFSNPFDGVTPFPVAFIILLNVIIGLKVGASIAYMCIVMMGRSS